MGGSSSGGGSGLTESLVRIGTAVTTGGLSEVARATEFEPLQKVTGALGPGGLGLINSEIRGMSEQAVGLPDPFAEPEIKLPSMPSRSDVRRETRRKARAAQKLKPGRRQTILTRGTGIFDE